MNPVAVYVFIGFPAIGFNRFVKPKGPAFPTPEKNCCPCFPDLRSSREYQSMATSNCEIFLHMVWTTSGRQPDLHPSVRTHVLECIRQECRALNTNVLALNAVDDHVHLLVRIGGAVSSGTVAKQIKGVSSRLMNTALRRPGFRWQEGYGATASHAGMSKR